jgi:hypothetical protein
MRPEEGAEGAFNAGAEADASANTAGIERPDAAWRHDQTPIAVRNNAMSAMTTVECEDRRREFRRRKLKRYSQPAIVILTPFFLKARAQATRPRFITLVRNSIETRSDAGFYPASIWLLSSFYPASIQLLSSFYLANLSEKPELDRPACAPLQATDVSRIEVGGNNQIFSKRVIVCFGLLPLPRRPTLS